MFSDARPAFDREAIYARILAAIDRERDVILGVGDDIHAHPELGMEEVHASTLLTETIARYGYEVERGSGGLPTAFKAIRGGKGSGPAIAFQLLICPILDVYGQSPARHELAEGYFLDSETLERDLELYVPQGVELTDIRLSPLRAEEFADLPMAFIHTAQFDPFSDEGEAYAQRLGGFGVPVHGRAHSGMIHYFYCMPRMIPYALEAVRIIGNEIRYAVDLPVRERRFHRRIRPELIRA